MVENSKLAFIGRDYLPVWDSKGRLGVNLQGGQPLLLDYGRKEHTFIVAKSGGGKSYLAGVIAESLIETQQNYATVIIDPMGIFATLDKPNPGPEVKEWNAQTPDAIRPHRLTRFKIWVPEGDKHKFAGAYHRTFSLPASAFSDENLCAAFDFDIFDPQVNLYRHAQNKLIERGESYDLDDIVRYIGECDDYQRGTIDALTARLRALHEMGIISKNGIAINEMVRDGEVAIFNLSRSTPHAARVLINFFAEQLLILRKEAAGVVIDARAKQIRVPKPATYVPPTQLVIDEAHNYFPKNPILIRAVKEGRNVALMITAISQSPDLPDDMFANTTNLFVGPMVFDKDIARVQSMMPIHKTPLQMRDQAKELSTGCFWYYNFDKKVERRIRVRPRFTLHPASTELGNEMEVFQDGTNSSVHEPATEAVKISRAEPDPVSSPVVEVPQVGSHLGSTSEPETVTPKRKRLAPIALSIAPRPGPSFTKICRDDEGYETNQIRPLVLKGRGMVGEVQIVRIMKKRLEDLPADFVTYSTQQSTVDEGIKFLNSFHEDDPAPAGHIWTILICAWHRGNLVQPYTYADLKTGAAKQGA